MAEESARALAEDVRTGRASAEAAVAAALERARAQNPAINALLAFDDEGALTRARAIDAMTPVERAQRPLAGVPVVVKDNIITQGIVTTAGSRILDGFRPPFQSTAVAKLEAAGAVVIGKSNLDEFGMGSSTEHSAFGPTRNPWDRERVPGGSSGGSAAALAAGMVSLALGTDTGGSIRQPAAFCGVVGLKPTYGRVSRFGLIAYASSLDQIGPMARSVEDAALLLTVIAGPDDRDATTAPALVGDYLRDLERPLDGLRLGVPAEFFEEGIDAGVKETVEAALAGLERDGVRLVPIRLPHTRYAIATYYLIAPAEASSNLSRFDGVRYGFRADADDVVAMYGKTRAQGFGPEVKRRILLGAHALSSGYYDQYYLKAQKVRTLIRRDFDQALNAVDLVVTPTAPETAFAIGSRADDPLRMYLSDICTVTANLAGLPAISIPCGTDQGLPVGLQLIGPAFSEGLLLRAARMAEQILPRPEWPFSHRERGGQR